MHRGFVKLWREWEEQPFWTDANMCKLWLHLIMNVSHKKRRQSVGCQIVTLEPGQMVFGGKIVAQRVNMTEAVTSIAGSTACGDGSIRN